MKPGRKKLPTNLRPVWRLAVPMTAAERAECLRVFKASGEPSYVAFIKRLLRDEAKRQQQTG